ncbi:hypothetical protein MMC13_003769 [Lambiella insularis]|nr:hypothetical protein [Lambiella insularis]
MILDPALRKLSSMDETRNAVTTDKTLKKDSSESTRGEKKSPEPLNPSSATRETFNTAENKEAKSSSNAEVAQPLAPPPRPAPLQQQQSTTDTPDYFSSVHNNSHYSLEPNLFEQSFGNPSSEIPGKSLLPPVASLTSPAPLTGNAGLAGGYGWSSSLRSGPLSPAMLSGPAGGDYFDSHIRGGFPTPNESSLRTGLTPGGGGSMFPAASPNSQALYQQLASGGATPGTLEFHGTALSAAAARKLDQNYTNGVTSQPQDHHAQAPNMDSSSQQQTSHQHFGQHDNDAANGLFLLAQAGNETQSNNQFAVPPQPTHGLPIHSQDTPSNLTKRSTRNMTGSLGDSISGAIREPSDLSADVSDGADQSKPNTRAKTKRTSSGKVTNGRRKAEDTPSKQPTAKKGKNNNGAASVNAMVDMDMSMEGMDSDEEANIKEEQYHENGKKMTDEEKRKNFLERNRVAALKCRQRKKQWLANLQAKVEIFSSENDALSAQVTQLREEILNLKTILIAHKDCPISQQTQGVASYMQHGPSGDYNNHANPYNMGMQSNQQVMAGPRRYS